jgi:ubiquinone/menaquinone biosynthesis C-methylase UbiE
MLLEAIPLETRLLLDLGCGTAAAAHILLPERPQARYLGLELLPELLAKAQKQMSASPRMAVRSEILRASPRELPLKEASTDVVLSIMALQHIPEVPEALTEALRVLRSGGRMVAVEPDNLGQRFYFDSVLEEISAVIHTLCLKARVARQPADIALGPRLPALLRQARFAHIEMSAHLIHSSRMETANEYFNRLRRLTKAIARSAGLDPADSSLQACEQAISRCQYFGMPKRVGFSAHTVPVFCCVATKP